GCAALADRRWAEAMRAQLAADAIRADAMARAAGWACLGGAALFRLYDTPDAAAARDHLARHHIWSRIFPYSPRWLRLGLPGPEAEWRRLEMALAPQRPI
ncbi:MAG: threonine-phosphate decarboxylase, partial [Alphaproteobacteria bacterium HGW-Alphaproteobacteria-8]